jgi:hypothetical protein
MKKTSFFLFVCVFILPCAWGLETEGRTFEFGFNANVGFANDFLSARDIFQETFVLDLDQLMNGFMMNLGFGATPLYFNHNNKNGWGFGLSINTEAVGIFSLSGKLLSFNEAVNDKSEISGAVFADIAPSGYFHLQKLKIKIKPALYVPVAYAKSDISYTFNNTTNGTVLNIGYEMSVFTAFSTGDSAGFNLTTRPGVDLSIGAEYPLSDALGISNKIFFLDFDLGLDLINIPLLPSAMHNYMKIDGSIGSDEPINFFGDDGLDMDSFFSTDNDTKYGEKEQTVLRPFKMFAWANWRPLGIRLFTVTPTFGFAVDPLYIKPFSLEGGIKARLDLFNFFIAAAGIGYYDRLWKNSIDLAFNLRVFELNIGADLRSQKFTKSLSGGGFGLSIGLKFGL